MEQPESKINILHENNNNNDVEKCHDYDDKTDNEKCHDYDDKINNEKCHDYDDKTDDELIEKLLDIVSCLENRGVDIFDNLNISYDIKERRGFKYGRGGFLTIKPSLSYYPRDENDFIKGYQIISSLPY